MVIQEKYMEFCCSDGGSVHYRTHWSSSFIQICWSPFEIRGLFKKYPDWNFSGCSLGRMRLQPVLTCPYMS